MLILTKGKRCERFCYYQKYIKIYSSLFKFKETGIIINLYRRVSV